MFSYSFKIRKLNNQSSKLKAFVSIVIDDIMEIDGFKIIDGSNGLFVSAPSHKGTVVEDGIQKEKYFDDVRFVGDEGLSISNEIKQAIINEYSSGKESTSPSTNPTPTRAAAAKAQVKASTPKPTGQANRKEPIWGF